MRPGSKSRRLCEQKKNNAKNSAGADGGQGSSLPGLRMLDPLLGPQSTPAEFFQRTYLQSHLENLPQPLRSYTQSAGGIFFWCGILIYFVN